jgi:hypothetical protein
MDATNEKWTEEFKVFPIELRKVIFSFFYQPFQCKIIIKLASVSLEPTWMPSAILKAQDDEFLFQVASLDCIQTINVEERCMKMIKHLSWDGKSNIARRDFYLNRNWMVYNCQILKSCIWTGDNSKARLYSKAQHREAACYYEQEIEIEYASGCSTLVIPKTLYQNSSPVEIEVIQNGGLLILLKDGSILLME